MELNWSTFILEIVNFLILIWILKRFLYRPVLEIIARRRERVEKTLADAEAINAEAHALQEKYQSRLADWETEKNEARESLQREIAAERAQRLKQLQSELDKEREKSGRRRPGGPLRPAAPGTAVQPRVGGMFGRRRLGRPGATAG